MIAKWTSKIRAGLVLLLGAAALAGSPVALAQVQAVDPDKAIDGDLVKPEAAPSPKPSISIDPSVTAAPPPASPAATAAADPAATAVPAKPAAQAATYKQDDLIGAAEGVFGKGAKGLATMIQDLLKKQGEPNGYIVGREGGGALWPTKTSMQ